MSANHFLQSQKAKNGVTKGPEAATRGAAYDDDEDDEELAGQQMGAANKPAQLSKQRAQNPATRRAWLWKQSVGRSLLGRRNWKLRFVECDTVSMRYYNSEPFDKPKSAILWRAVLSIYDRAPPGSGLEETMDNGSQIFYFGFRFTSLESIGEEQEGTGNEDMQLMFRTDDAIEHASWVSYMRKILSLYRDPDSFASSGKEGVAISLSSYSIVERLKKKLRHMVSLKKKRFNKDGMDLDLAYVLPNVIAMGYPTGEQEFEAAFRNPMNAVVGFFDKYHKQSFRVYNLCSERWYGAECFGGKFERFPFDDHNPCPMEMLFPICENMYTFLNSGEEHVNWPDLYRANIERLQGTQEPVAALHCKAGKGRTGLVICAFMLYAGVARDVEQSVLYFAMRRTKDGKGIQIPSQKRYLAYFFSSIRDHGGELPSKTITIQKIELSGPLPVDQGTPELYAVVEKRPKRHSHRPIGHTEGNACMPLDNLLESQHGRRQGNSGPIEIPIEHQFVGVTDFRVSLRRPGATKPVCTFWLHTGFLPSSGEVELHKAELDMIVKDKRVSSDFTLTMSYTIDGDGPQVFPPRNGIPCLEEHG